MDGKLYAWSESEKGSEAASSCHGSYCSWLYKMQASPAQPSRQQHFHINPSPEYLKTVSNTSVSQQCYFWKTLHSVLCAARWTLSKDKCSLSKTSLPSTLEHQVPVLLPTGIIWLHGLRCFLDTKSHSEAASFSHQSPSWPTQLPLSDPKEEELFIALYGLGRPTCL